MCAAVVQVIIYRMAKYEKVLMKNDREIADSGKELNEKKKKQAKQQQKGLPTLSADLNKMIFTKYIVTSARVGF